MSTPILTSSHTWCVCCPSGSAHVGPIYQRAADQPQRTSNVSAVQSPSVMPLPAPSKGRRIQWGSTRRVGGSQTTGTGQAVIIRLTPPAPNFTANPLVAAVKARAEPMLHSEKPSCLPGSESSQQQPQISHSPTQGPPLTPALGWF